LIKNIQPLPSTPPLPFIKRKTILWVGAPRSIKQPEVFIKFIEQLANETGTMICSINLKFVSAFRALQKTALRIPNLHFLEYVPFDQIDRYFAEAKVFVNTSLNEGFPNTFVQAAKCGTPIVSLQVDPDHFLEEYRCGYTAQGDFNRLVENTKKLLTDQTLWEEISANAFRYAKENHDIVKITEEYKRIIKELVT
jgi:glycosyltransferase involved in cell wall biosynthesis